MDADALREWLAGPRTDLIASVADGVRAHVAALRSVGADFYGYALLPGEPYDIGNLVAATNGEADIPVPRGDGQYGYYRHSVDEWRHYHRGAFAEADRIIAALNDRFRSLHAKDDGDFSMDEFEVAHADALLDALVGGLDAARLGGAFGSGDTFLAVWIPDSGHGVVVESVRRLNPPDVAGEFVREFG